MNSEPQGAETGQKGVTTNPQKFTALQAGAGNIGSHLAPLLARAGIGTLHIVDRDIVETKNLIQQDYEPHDIGRSKAEALAERLGEKFPALRVEAFYADLEDVPLGAFRVDVLFGALDSRRARQVLVSERGWPLGVPVIDGAVGEGLLGRVQTFIPGAETACLECGWSEADYRLLAAEYPCLPGAFAHAPGTVSPACVGAVVAGLMAARCLCLIDRSLSSDSREIACDLRHNRFLESRLRRGTKCRFDHRIVSERLVVPCDARVGDLAALVKRRFGSLAAHLEGKHRPGNGFAANRFLPVESLLATPDDPLTSLGLSPGDGVRVRAGDESVFVFVEEGHGTA
jgi:molybdopterin/thiamine biosynthesis adenylyltransferase